MENKLRITFNELALLDGLAPATIAAMQNIAKEIRLAPGERLFNQGDESHNFYAVLCGGVRLIEHTIDGKDVNLKIYGPNDVFGMLALSGIYAHRADIVAVQYSELISFDGEQSRRIMQQHADLALRVIDLLIKHVHEAHSRIRQFAAEKTERRLARALLHFCRKFGHSPELEANFSQQDIAEFTGTTAETVNRIFRDWEKRGMIHSLRKKIRILNAEALRQIAIDPDDFGMGYLLE